MKKTVLHIIESLVIGGAEVLLTESLKDMSGKYRHVLVYLRPDATLLPEVKADKVYCLHFKGKSNILSCILSMRKIMRQEQVDLIHAHHYWPTIIARLANRNRLPLLFTLHNPLSQDAFLVNPLSLYLEKLTYHNKQHAIFISESVKQDYEQYISRKGPGSLLPNFVADKFFDVQYALKCSVVTGKPLRVVAVGTLKRQKNYLYLLELFGLLKDEPISLEIIGDGPLREQLTQFVKEKELNNVKLIGTSTEIANRLRNYDAFIMASTYEGMSLAVIEAMAIGLPCLLSDIPSNREVANDAALYFSLSFPRDAVEKLKALASDHRLRQRLSVAGREQAQQYKKKKYLAALEELYNQYLSP